MFNIVENPKTKRLYMQGNCQHEGGRVSTYSFDGTPISQNIDGWKAVATGVPCVADWIKNPGDFNTLAMSTTICLIPTEESKPEVFTMGGTLSYITNWIKDAKVRNFDAYTINEEAYSCRNAARQGVRVQV